ncbi:MAG: hypothetical protein K2W85_03320 [Phycisphaerales bacterium]|nr:hypothetical protein [Phycisphaerales bacterium]
MPRINQRSNRSRAAAVRATLAVVLALGGMGVAAATAFRGPPPPTDAPITSAELRVTLYRAGLDPAALTAVGCSAQQLQLLLNSASSRVSSDLAALRAADAQLASARTSRDQLFRKVQSGIGTEQDAAALRAAQLTLSTAQAQQAGAFEAVRTAALAQSLTTEQIALLATVRANAQWDVPVQYRTVQRTEAEWVGLRDALAAVAIAAREGRAAPGAAAQIVNAANADTPVANATAWLASWGPQNDATFAQLTAIQP